MKHGAPSILSEKIIDARDGLIEWSSCPHEVVIQWLMTGVFSRDIYRGTLGFRQLVNYFSFRSCRGTFLFRYVLIILMLTS